jgi:uncharacterized membrane protein
VSLRQVEENNIGSENLGLRSYYVIIISDMKNYKLISSNFYNAFAVSGVCALKLNIHIRQPNMIEQILFAVVIHILQLIAGIHIDMRRYFITYPHIRAVLVYTLLHRTRARTVIQVIE